MPARLINTLCLLALGTALSAADAPEPKSRMKEILRARAAEEAKKNPTPPIPISPPATTTSAPTNPPSTPPVAAPAPTAPAAPPVETKESPAATTEKAAPEPATALPKVEVRRERVTVLEHRLHEQDKAIEREKKNARQSETDRALNDSKVSKALSIFGGESSQYRSNIANERVRLMEDEKDLIEAIAFAKTKAEKAELEKELEQLKALRRDLEKSLR